VNGGTPTTYCYDKADRLTSTTEAAVGTIAYDAHGNTTSIFGETHTYDAADRHVSTTKPGTTPTTVTYTRDATDRIVARKLGATTVARYGSTGSGDAPDFTMNASNVLQEVTFSLPGGALLTTRAAGNVWSYPNIHGDVTAIANQSGAKQLATRTFDAYGNLTTGPAPDNSAGNFDNGWLGQHQRATETEAALQPTIEMGARQYSPLLGRFLQVDPIEGGTTTNDYGYVPDPVNQFDLNGQGGYYKWVSVLYMTGRGRDHQCLYWMGRVECGLGGLELGRYGVDYIYLRKRKFVQTSPSWCPRVFCFARPALKPRWHPYGLRAGRAITSIVNSGDWVPPGYHCTVNQIRNINLFFDAVTFFNTKLLTGNPRPNLNDEGHRLCRNGNSTDLA
jgi:RHS repeat-associated protein